MEGKAIIAAMARRGLRVVRTRRGARVVQGGTVLSEVLAAPGPTHTLFDVLAAAVSALSPGPRVALLGFAAGGIVAPLRAMGFPHDLEAVDLSLEGELLFRMLSRGWAGAVSLAHADAADWLRTRRRAYHLIVEDLFLEEGPGMAKPRASLTTLPALIRRRLVPGGVAVINTLPVPGLSWREVLRPLSVAFSEAHVVRLDEYENRILVAGDDLGGAHGVSRRLRSTLRAIRSRQAERISVDAFRRG